MTARLIYLAMALGVAGCAQPVQPSSPAAPVQKLGHETAQAARQTLNTSLRLQQIAVQTNDALQQKAWEAQVYAASPNVTAKVTTMINPMDAKGRIMEQQILTYYDNGTMRYATNFFNRAK